MVKWYSCLEDHARLCFWGYFPCWSFTSVVMWSILTNRSWDSMKVSDSREPPGPEPWCLHTRIFPHRWDGASVPQSLARPLNPRLVGSIQCPADRCYGGPTRRPLSCPECVIVLSDINIHHCHPKPLSASLAGTFLSLSSCQPVNQTTQHAQWPNFSATLGSILFLPPHSLFMWVNSRLDPITTFL